VITSIHFQDFRVIEKADLPLGPFNLLLGPNGSGKTTAVSAVLALGDVAAARRVGRVPLMQPDLAGATAEFQFGGNLAGGRVVVRFDATGRPATTFAEPAGSPGAPLVEWLGRGLRGYVLDPAALARSVVREAAPILEPDGAGLAAVLASLRRGDARRWTELVAEFRRMLPEYADIIAGPTVDGVVAFSVADVHGRNLPARNLSQGTLVILAMLALVFALDRPTVLCLEEIERGIHPRLLRDVRDLLYRLSFPEDSGDTAPAVQVITTTHSPYVLDLFADTPEDVILATRRGETEGASFKRLCDVPEVGELMREGRLGDLWYSGIFGGNP
jgi:predicted ATPase